MSKSGFMAIDGLLYDCNTPPKKFTKIFQLQAVFADWDDKAMAKNIPLFLEKKAIDVFEKCQNKTVIKAIIKDLEEKCVPTKEQYMAMFFARKRQQGETMVQYGKSLEELLKGGCPDLVGDALTTLLKMQLNQTAPELSRVLVNFNKDLTCTEMLEGLDRSYPTPGQLATISGLGAMIEPGMKLEKADVNSTMFCLR
jgi:hypothetical protein